MPDYIIRIIDVARPIEDHPFTGDRGEARRLARDMASDAFPGATITGGAKSDAFVAKDGDEYLGTVSVERPD